MATRTPVAFSELKSKVGVDDIAYSLGYRVDKKAGVGKYVEMILGDSGQPIDKIVVRNTSDKASQFFFRRDGSKGDVITFIKENINSFNVTGGNDWTKVINILAKAANMPSMEVDDRNYVRSQSATCKVFDPDRYVTEPVNPENLPYLLRQRGLSTDCVRQFGHNVVLIKDTHNTKFDGYNIGFPYINPSTGNLAGYEIRGSKGFKSKASGTDSAHSAWLAEFPRDTPHAVRNVYFFESCFDAMAFFQINKAKLSMTPFALVSVGGAFNPELAGQIMERFPVAKAWDCFDNDLAGEIYSAQLAKTVDRLEFSIASSDDGIKIQHGDRSFQCLKEEFCFRHAAIDLGISYSCGHWKSPRNYKDWNDCLLGNQIEPKLSPSKYTRDENLAQKRQSSVKI